MTRKWHSICLNKREIVGGIDIQPKKKKKKKKKKLLLVHKQHGLTTAPETSDGISDNKLSREKTKEGVKK